MYKPQPMNLTKEQLQRKLAEKEAHSTWVSPLRLGLIFVISLAFTIYFNGI